MDVLRDNVEECVRLLAESVMCPSLLDEDIMACSVFLHNFYKL